MRIQYSRSLCFSALFILFICWSGARAQTSGGGLPEWREFRSEAGGFSVKLPGNPKIQTTDGNVGPVSYKRYIHLLSIGSFTFEVDYIESPTGSSADLSVEGGIAGFINKLTADGATLLSKDTVTRGACVGRDATLSLRNSTAPYKGFAQGQAWSSGSRYYVLTFFSKEDTSASRAVAGTFVESFVINGSCSTLVAPVEVPPSTAEDFTGAADPATGWLKIDTEELGFKVLMPGSVRHTIDHPQAKPFPVTHHTYFHSKDGTVYSAEVFGEYPPGFFKSRAYLQSMVDLTLYQLKKNLPEYAFTALRDLRVDTFPGREYSMVNEKSALRGRAQIYVTDRRIFVFMAVAHDQGVTSKLIEQFFGSLRVSPN